MILAVLALHLIKISWAVPLINTLNGFIRGVNEELFDGERHVTKFLGVPYAEPPIGKLRFERPQEVKSWKGVWNADSFAPSCVQSYTISKAHRTTDDGIKEDEDCLYLNIWKQKRTSKGATIMVYIHGGSDFTGTASSILYDGSVLAAYGEVIVITFNYRVGVLGFLTTGDERIPGNFGLYDQAMALKWIANNAHAFGGSSSKVVVFGTGTGAIAVGFHLLYKPSQKLIRRAILQSGSPSSPHSQIALKNVEKLFAKFASSHHCQNVSELLKCLRNIPQENFTSLKWKPVYDGDIVSNDQNYTTFIENLRGVPVDIDLMLGSNHKEGTKFLIDKTPGFSYTTTSHKSRTEFQQYSTWLCRDLGPFVTHAIQFYYTYWPNPGSPEHNRDNIINIQTDRDVYCPVYQMANIASKRKQPKKNKYIYDPWEPPEKIPNVYLYLFTHTGPLESYDWIGVQPESELQWIFGYPFSLPDEYTKSDMPLTHQMILQWTSFAKTGDPNIDKTSVWEKFKKDTKFIYIINKDSSKSVTAPRINYCAFWDVYVKTLQKDLVDSCPEERRNHITFPQYYSN